MPAEAKGTSEASAKAFVHYYIDALNFAGSTGDTAELKQISSPECESCSGIIDKIDRVYSDGGYFKGAGWSVQAIEAVSGQPRDRPILQVGIFVAEQEALEEQGGKVQYFEGGRKPTTFRLKRDEGWTVARIDQVQ